MRRRTAGSFALFLLAMFWVLMKVYSVSSGEQLAAAAAAQGVYEVEITRTRGTIYDAALTPLVGTSERQLAAVVPSTEAAAALSRILPQEEMQAAYRLLSQGSPFSLELPAGSGAFSAPGVDVFSVDIRYQDPQTASHVIGYLDGSGHGVSGIEKAFDAYLSADPGRIAVKYKVDAVHRVLQGEQREIENTTAKKQAGVVLTLDAGLQQKAEELLREHLGKGAAVVIEVSTGKIRAMASTPSFSPDGVAAALDAPDSPFLNRCLEAYNAGSVFKLAVAAAALESGISPQEEYECEGFEEVAGARFHCFDGAAHGEVGMQEAVAQSCNAYFVRLAQELPDGELLRMAEALGFGQGAELAPGMLAKSGNLPTLEELEQPRALANFSFGQGSLLVTPLQVAGMVQCIANGGVAVEPALVEGLVDETLAWVWQPETPRQERVLQEETARLLREFMAASVDHGTGRDGRPLLGMAGAKTGTAQTGRVQDGEEAVQAWYAGFYPLNDPQVAIVVFGEDEPQGGGACAPVFRGLADWLALES